MMRAGAVARSVGEVIAWCSIASLVITLAVVAHLATPLGRAAVAEGAGMLLSSRIRGEAHIGSVSRLDFQGIEMRDVWIVSSAGERVIAADRWEAGFAYGDSWDAGHPVLGPSALEGGSMRITSGPADRIELVHTMEVPDERFMLTAEVRDIELSHLSIVFALPGVPGEVEMSEVSGTIDMSLGHRFEARMSGMRGVVNVPAVDVGFRRLSGRLTSDAATPLVVRMALDLDVAEPSMEVHYRITPGEDAHGHMDIILGDGVPDERHVGRRAS